MQRGLDWYKREPQSMCDAKRAARMTIRQAAIYDLVIDLIYIGGGKTPNDPAYIAAHFSDIGAAATRNIINDLCEMPHKLITNGDYLTQKRAENEAKTRRNLRETRSEIGRLGGVSSGFSRREGNENNGLSEANASSKTEAEKRRVEKKRDVVNTTSNAGARKADFETWWRAYPHKVGKGAARTAFEKAFKNHNTSLQELSDGLSGYIKTKPPDRNWCNPATWLNQERWKDEPDNKTGNTISSRNPENRSGAQIMFDASTELAAEYDAGIYGDENQSGFAADPGTKEMDISKGEYSSRPLLPSKGR